MSEDFRYYRKTNGEIHQASNALEVFPGWRGEKECWLFLSPHDDDSVIGAGLTVLAAEKEGIEAHVVVTTDGSMGYCDEAERLTIAETRKRETIESCRLLGIPFERVHFLGFPDGGLHLWAGRKVAEDGDPGVVKGYVGLQNSFTFILRHVNPSRVFMPTNLDFHPDHQVSNREMKISLFHAQGAIWPELGEPIELIPEVYEYATYCDFEAPPQIKIETSPEQLARKLKSIAAFVSQKQITVLVEQLRAGGPVEYLYEAHFRFYSPKVYENLF